MGKKLDMPHLRYPQNTKHAHYENNSLLKKANK
jgi:hypothetical protein